MSLQTDVDGGREEVARKQKEVERLGGVIGGLEREVVALKREVKEREATVHEKVCFALWMFCPVSVCLCILVFVCLCAVLFVCLCARVTFCLCACVLFTARMRLLLCRVVLSPFISYCIVF